MGIEERDERMRQSWGEATGVEFSGEGVNCEYDILTRGSRNVRYMMWVGVEASVRDPHWYYSTEMKQQVG